MLETVGHAEEGDPTGAVKAFQAEHDLSVDGVVGPKTRRALFLAYMDAICVDEEGAPFHLDKGEFLGGGVDLGGKGDVQGCGEFNPALLLSREELRTLPKPERDVENTPNRRVVAFLFRPGARVDALRWPCPRVKEGVAGCRKRLWSDGEARRTPGEERREYKQTRDTFACRFYDRMAKRSPCEGLRNTRAVGPEPLRARSGGWVARSRRWATIPSRARNFDRRWRRRWRRQRGHRHRRDHTHGQERGLGRRRQLHGTPQPPSPPGQLLRLDALTPRELGRVEATLLAPPHPLDPLHSARVAIATSCVTRQRSSGPRDLRHDGLGRALTACAPAA
jgi:hypothetical protein